MPAEPEPTGLDNLPCEKSSGGGRMTTASRPSSQSDRAVLAGTVERVTFPNAEERVLRNCASQGTGTS